MGATIAIVKKEFADFISSPKFWIVFAIFLFMSMMATFQGVQNYEKELERYGNIVQKNESIKNGLNNELPPQFILNIPKPTILSAYEVLPDSIATMGALLALILGYRAVAGERKTLKILLSYPVYRDSVINAKFISRILTIFLTLFATLTISTGIILTILDITPSSEELGRLFLFIFSSIIYMTFFLCIGIFLSIIAKRESTSLYACLMLWFLSAVLISRIAYFVSSMLVPIPPSGSVDTDIKKGILMKRLDVADSILSLSPSYHFLQFSGYMLSPHKTNEIFSGSYVSLPISQSLAYSWPNITLLLMGIILLFVASYIRFMKEDF